MLDKPRVAGADLLATAAGLVQATGYHFITPTPLTHARVNARPGNEWARGLRDVFGWSRPFQPDALTPEIFSAMRDAGVLIPLDKGGWRSLIRLSSLGGLLFAHSAFPTDQPDAVFFGPDTYRFAHAIDLVLHKHPVRRAVDIGCGAGPGAIMVAKAWPGAEVLAVDINGVALRLTRSNAALAGAVVEAVESDLLDAVPGQFDLIVSNPPYLIDPLGRAYRHGGGPLGAGLSLDILDTALERLAPGGTLLLYTGSVIIDGHDAFEAAVMERVNQAGLTWDYRETDPDVFGEELAGGAYATADRIAAVVLTVRKI